MNEQQPLPIQQRTPFDQPRSLPNVNWHEAPEGCLEFFQSNDQAVKFRYGTISQGRGAGVDVIEADTGPMQIAVLPTRGMGIWQVVCDGVPFQWHSPVQGPIHPALVPTFDPSGLGWLEGFDEFIVRCGISSNGAPSFNELNQLTHPVHGRIANLPAGSVWCETDEASCVLAGKVSEQRLFFTDLELVTRIKLKPGGREFQIVDTVTNHSSKSSDVQMLYHVNVGSPVLQGGSELFLPAEEVAPRDHEAALGIQNWSKIEQPETGFKEQVYFCRLAKDKNEQTSVMLQSASTDKGLGLSFDTRTLPHFIVWKNTADLRDGYVTGLEPATNLPNRFPFEKRQGRVVDLQSQESVQFQLSVHPLTTEAACADFKQRVDRLMIGQPKTTTCHSPKPGWSE